MDVLRVIVAGVLSAALTSCASVGRQINAADVEQVSVGVTTKDQMLLKFGPPTSQAMDTSGKLVMTWIYFYFGYMGIGSEQQSLAVLFDSSDVVERVSLVGDQSQNAPRLGH